MSLRSEGSLSEKNVSSSRLTLASATGLPDKRLPPAASRLFYPYAGKTQHGTVDLRFFKVAQLNSVKDESHEY
jgi:hypothetical protein